MIESISGFLNTALVVALGVIGWIIKRVIERLDLGEKRMTKIEVELAAQKERDIAVENRIGKVETAIQEMHNKLDRMMEILVRKQTMKKKKPGLYENMRKRKALGISRSKKDSTVSDKAYAAMERDFKNKRNA